MTERLEETLRRLKEERDEADRRYNDALTALDKSFKPPGALPAAPPPYDEHQITPLNEAWNILPSPPAATGVAARLTGFIWRTVAPYLQRQLTFNSRLVDHLNRNAIAHRDAHRTLHDTLALLNAQAAAQTEFHTRLLLLLQQITPLRRHQGSGQRRWRPRPQCLVERHGRSTGQAHGIDGRPRITL